MFRTLATGTLLATLAWGTAQAASLDDLRWKNRVLVIFATSTGSQDLAEQERRLSADLDALSERELVILAVEGGQVRPIFGETPSRPSADALRARLDIDPATSFRAVLVGKDGGVKWTADAPADLADIKAVIDSMPMRRAGGN